jgi:Holliday junction resolvase RusA-like endonuclease
MEVKVMTTPNTPGEMLQNVSETVRQNVVSAAAFLTSDKIKWNNVSFVLPIEPKPSQRPRLSGYRVYVPGAAKASRWFDRVIRPQLKGLFITTPMKITLDIYVKTPTSSMNRTQQCLAEMKMLRPWGSTGDVDNYEKAVYDMMQPNMKRGVVGIMQDDSLIIEAHTNKYYSMTPRYEVSITYMDDDLPDDIRKLLRLQEREGD